MNRIRVVSILLVISLVLGGAVACGMPAKLIQKDGVRKITIWHYYNGEQKKSLDSLIQEYNEGIGRNNGIQVQGVSSGSIADLEDNILAAVEKRPGADTVPNIIMVYNEMASRLDEKDLLENLADHFAESELDQYVNSYLSEGMLSGNRSYIKILPVAKSTELMYLNKTDWDVFARETGAELSKLSTMEGIADIARMYYEWSDSKTEEVNDGKALFGRDDLSNFIFISGKQMGVDVVTAGNENRVVINFPEDFARRIWDCYYVPYIHGYFKSAALYHSDDVKTGNVLCYVGSSASRSFFPKYVIRSDTEKYEIECQTLKAPKLEGGMDYAIQQGAGLSVLKGEKEDVDASIHFLKWLSTGEENVRLAVSAGYLPVTKAYSSQEAISRVIPESEQTEAVKLALETVESNDLYTTPAAKGSRQIRSNIGKYLQDRAESDRRLVETRLSEGMSPEEAMGDLLTEENFRQWYEEMQRRLSRLVENGKF